MIDLSGLSDKELLDLQKRIKEERESRNDARLYKNNIYQIISGSLYTKFQERDKVPAKHTALSTPFHRVTKSIYTICDYTLGNFNHKIGNLDNPFWTANTNYIKVDSDAYKNMVHDLIDVINKYFNGQNNAESLV